MKNYTVEQNGLLLFRTYWAKIKMIKFKNILKYGGL